MSIIEEHISGEIQHYVPGENGAPGSWVTYENGILSDANVISASCKRQCCEDGKFTIGGVFAATMQLVCRLPGFTRYQLGNARIILRSQYAGEMQAVPVGTFWATKVSRVHDVFTIRGMDAMGWMDVLVPVITEQRGGGGYFVLNDNPPPATKWIPVPVVNISMSIARQVFDRDGNEQEEYVYTLSGWFHRFFLTIDSILESKTGIGGLAEYRLYNDSLNCNIKCGNNYKFTNLWAIKINSETGEPEVAFFGLYMSDNVYKSEKPRDILRWIAEAVGGFITVERDGKFTMRQFCMPELGIAEINDNDMEMDSLELADYYLFPDWIDCRFQGKQFTIIDDYYDEKSLGFRLRITENPISSGFNDASIDASVAYGIYYAFVQYEDVDRIDGENVLVPSVNQQHIGLYKAYPVPFRCRVHKAERYELGQTVIFPDHVNTINNYRYGKVEHVPYLRSVITSIEWTFRGGTVLSCGEGDTRSMMQLSQDGKADAALRELRNRV